MSQPQGAGTATVTKAPFNITRGRFLTDRQCATVTAALKHYQDAQLSQRIAVPYTAIASRVAVNGEPVDVKPCTPTEIDDIIARLGREETI